MKVCKLLAQAGLALLASWLALPALAQVSTKLVGVGVHSIGIGADAQTSQLDLVQRAGLGSVRTDAAWKYVEQVQGQMAVPASWDHFVDEALKRGIQPVLILDYGNPSYDGGDKPRSSEAIDGFVRYAQFVVRHFHGRVKTFEIWNEWDNHTGGFPDGSPEDYAAFFKRVYPALKDAFPDTRFLVGAGVKPGWYERLAKLGVLQQADGIAVHPYNYQKGSLLGPEDVAVNIRALQARLSRMTGRPSIDFYITEIGWPTNTGRFGTPESVVGGFATRVTALLMSLPYVRGVWWYDLVDDGANPADKESRFGLLRQDYSPKPAYLAMAKIAGFVRSHDLELSEKSELREGFVAIRLLAADGPEQGFLAWNAGSGAGSIQIECDPKDGPRVKDGSSNLLHLTQEPILVPVDKGVCSERPL
jgi:hypothetical protein